MKKEVVQNMIKVIERHLKALEDTVVSGKEEKLKALDSTIDELRKFVGEYKPSEHEMYSNHTRKLYGEMKKAWGFYDECKKLGASPEDIKEAEDNYGVAAKRYEAAKRIRDALKEV